MISSNAESSLSIFDNMQHNLIANIIQCAHIFQHSSADFLDAPIVPSANHLCVSTSAAGDVDVSDDSHLDIG